MTNCTAGHLKCMTTVAINRSISAVIGAINTGIGADCTAIHIECSPVDTNNSTVGVPTGVIGDLAAVHGQGRTGIDLKNTVVAANMVAVDDGALVHGNIDVCTGNIGNHAVAVYRGNMRNLCAGKGDGGVSTSRNDAGAYGVIVLNGNLI